ncbi:tetratricopeptide repeat protein [bacterium]|nr:MAG: tetratricopeptide repeat protein [bacterium]
MSKKEKILGKDQAVILGASCLIGGFLLGLLSYHLIAGQTSSAPQPQMQMAQQQMPPTVSPPGADLQNFSEQIKELTEITKTQPKNREAWVGLGNIYFDSKQPAEAVKAYTKALELDSNDPNVLTDRGIMYRELKDFQAALADFKKASTIDPNHAQSLYNIGITLLHDLNDPKGAVDAWDALSKRATDPELKKQMEDRVVKLKEMIAKQPPK